MCTDNRSKSGNIWKKTILVGKITRFLIWHLNYIMMLYLSHTQVQVGQKYSSLGQFCDYHMGWNEQIMLWFQVSLRGSSILPSIQTNSRANPPSFLFTGFWRLCVGVQWVWHEDDLSPQFSAEVMMHGDISPGGHAFIAWCCIKYTDTFNRSLPVSMSFRFIPSLSAFIATFNFVTINI